MGDLSTGDFAHGFFLTLEASSIHFRRHLNVHLISMIIIMPPSVLCVPQCPPAVHTCSERCTHAPAGALTFLTLEASCIYFLQMYF